MTGIGIIEPGEEMVVHDLRKRSTRAERARYVGGWRLT